MHILQNLFRSVKLAVPVVVGSLSLLVGPLVTESPAQTLPDYFAPACQAWGTTNAWVIIPPCPSRTPILRSVQVTSDLYDSRLTIFSNSLPAIALYDSTGTNIAVQSSTVAGEGGTNGFATGDIVIICHGSGASVNDSYERARVHAVTTTNIAITTTLARTLTAGSLVYRVGTNAFLKGYTNSSTTTLNSFIASGQRGQPLLIDASGTSAVSINLMGGEYK